MSEREERAEKRRREWVGEVVSPGAPKGPLYASLSPAERLAAFIELNRRAWLATGGSFEPLARSEWPGEVIDLRAR